MTGPVSPSTVASQKCLDRLCGLLSLVKRYGDLANATPLLGKENGIAGVLGIVLDRGRQFQPAGVQVDELTQVSHILRALVRNSGDIVLIDEQLYGIWLGWHFVNIDHGAIGDASEAAQTKTPLLLTLIGRFAATAHPIGNADCGNRGAAKTKRVKTKMVHTVTTNNITTCRSG